MPSDITSGEHPRSIEALVGGRIDENSAGLLVDLERLHRLLELRVEAGTKSGDNDIALDTNDGIGIVVVVSVVV
jgi:hypothetical protein